MHPLLAQLPEGSAVDAARDGTLRALVSVGADPERHLPGAAEVGRALSRLELLVCLDAVPRDLHRHAHWVLPVPHALEREDLHLLDTALLPGRFSQYTPALVSPPAEAREAHRALAELVRAARPPLRWGRAWLPWRLVARGLATSPLEPWVERMWRTATGVPLWQLREARHGLRLGEADRATWRVSGGRLDLGPPEIVEAAMHLEDPEDPPERPLWLGLRASAAWDGPRVEVHPEAVAHLGLSEGDEVAVVGPAGRAVARLSLDPALRRDAAVIPGAWGRGPHPAATAGPLADVLHGDDRDPFTGAPVSTGIRVGLEARAPR
jgi:formate dehydrogenase